MARHFATPYYYGWNIVGVGLVFQAIVFGLTFYCFTFWVVPWMDEFQISRGYIMSGYTGMTFVIGALMPFAGRALDTASIRVLVCLGTLSFAGGLVLVSVASAPWHIFAAYALLIMPGVAFAGTLPAQTLVVKWFRGRRGAAIGIVAIGTSLGGVVTPPLVAFLFDAVGWRNTNLVLAAMSVAIIVPLTWWIVRNTPEDKGIEPEPEAPRREGQSSAITFPQWTTATILRQPAFWVPIFSFVPTITAFTSIQLNLAPYALDRGLGLAEASLLMSLLSVAMIGGKLFFGAMADRWDHRILYWIATGSMALGVSIILWAPSLIGLVIAVATLGLAAGGFLPIQGAIFASRFGPMAFGRVSGLAGPFLTVSALGPAVTGWIRDSSGSYDNAFLLWLILIAPAVLVMYWLPQPSGSAEKEAA